MSDEKDGQAVGESDGQEDQLPEGLSRLAREYHEPPAVPREAIWARIRSARVDAPTVRPSDRPTVPRPPDRLTATARPSFRLPAWIGIAALLALGVAVGRWSLGAWRGSPEGPQLAAVDQPAHEGAVVRVAAAEHLSRTETLLTALRVGERGPALEAQARDLLLTTRFLLDARGVSEPRVRALLEDLELILVQLLQAQAGNGGELDLVTDALEQRDVLPRLRLALPPTL